MGWPGHRLALGLFISVLIIWMAAMAVLMRLSALPPEASGLMLAVFEPGTPEDALFASLTRADAQRRQSSGYGMSGTATGGRQAVAGEVRRAGWHQQVLLSICFIG